VAERLRGREARDLARREDMKRQTADKYARMPRERMVVDLLSDVSGYKVMPGD
jgi:hypothetical protein